MARALSSPAIDQRSRQRNADAEVMEHLCRQQALSILRPLRLTCNLKRKGSQSSVRLPDVEVLDSGLMDFTRAITVPPWVSR